jgi:hypothetical protein
MAEEMEGVITARQEEPGTDRTISGMPFLASESTVGFLQEMALPSEQINGWVVQAYIQAWLHTLCSPLSNKGLDILSNFELLERAVNEFDSRFTLRALRSIASIRKTLNAPILWKIIMRTYPADDQRAKIFFNALGT